ncbi:MAG: PLDc N-terminal domain-containing protein [Thermoleophilia bacterium]|nr:PLDc N-terminal domain-containing protein [Thermoleophilia bacterium]
MPARRWSEMGALQRALVLAASVVQFALLGAALWDLRRRDGSQIRGPKRLWSGIVFVNYVGPIAYFALGRKSPEFVSE